MRREVQVLHWQRWVELKLLLQLGLFLGHNKEEVLTENLLVISLQ